MIDLYVLAPEDKEGVLVDLTTNDLIAKTMMEIIELLNKNFITITTIELQNPFESVDKRSIRIKFISGENLFCDVLNNHILFVDEGQLRFCEESDLADRFGLTTDYKKANREFD